MESREARWALVVLVLMLLAYLIPYTLFRDVNAWYGSFLFWNLFALVIIVVNTFITMDWSD